LTGSRYRTKKSSGAHVCEYYANLDDDGIINPETVVREKDVS